MSKRKFNPLASHGKVTPPHNGAVFYQNGGYFNAKHELVFEDGPAPEQETIEKRVHTTSEDGSITTETTKVVKEGDDTDPRLALTAWLKGEVEIHHSTARSYVKDLYGEVIPKKDDLIAYLVNEAELVPAELVKVGA